DIEAVQAGCQAGTRGRSEDIIPTYQALRPEAHAAFRAGYVDPLITSAGRGARREQSAPVLERRIPRRSRGDGAGQLAYAAPPCARRDHVRNAWPCGEGPSPSGFTSALIRGIIGQAATS